MAASLMSISFLSLRLLTKEKQTRSRAVLTLSQNLLNLTQSGKQVQAVTPHLHGSYSCECSTNQIPHYFTFPDRNFKSVLVFFWCYVFLSNSARLVLLFPLVASVQPNSRTALIKSVSVSLLNSKSCFTIFCFLPSRRQSTFYRSA